MENLTVSVRRISPTTWEWTVHVDGKPRADSQTDGTHAVFSTAKQALEDARLSALDSIGREQRACAVAGSGERSARGR